MKKLLFSLMATMLFVAQTHGQQIVSDPTLTKATISNWIENLEQVKAQNATLSEQKNLLVQTVEMYTKVSRTVKNAVMIKDIISRQIDMVQFAHDAFSLNKSDIASPKVYENYTKRLTNIITHTTKTVELLNTILSDESRMTDGERLKFIMEIDEKTQYWQEQMREKKEDYESLNSRLQSLNSLKM